MALSFLAEVDPGPLALWASVFAAGNPAERIATVEAALKSKRGAYWRGEIGRWIGRLVPVEILVPDSAQRWRPLVRDAFQFLFERLSDRRLATKVVQQFELSADTPPEQRLLRLVNKMPGLKQVKSWISQAKKLPRVVSY